MKEKLLMISTVFMSLMLLSGCAAANQSPTAAETAQVSQTEGLLSASQPQKPSPEWVTKLEAAKDSEQLIVVAGYDKNTAYISMHEKDISALAS